MIKKIVGYLLMGSPIIALGIFSAIGGGIQPFIAAIITAAIIMGVVLLGCKLAGLD